MIKHIVIFKLKEGVSKDDPRVAEVAQATEQLPDQISDIKDFFCGMNVTDRPIAYDFGLVAGLDDTEALGRYLAHPAHVAAVAFLKEIYTWNIADIPIE